MSQPIEEFLSRVRDRLGWRHLIERRSLAEVRDHLEDSAERLSSERRETFFDPEQEAVDLFGSVDETVAMIVDSNRGLRTMMWFSGRQRGVMTVLLLPALVLMAVSVLTFKADLRLIYGLAGPLELLDGKFIAIRVLMTTVLPIMALVVAFKESVRWQRGQAVSGSRMTLMIEAPARLLVRLSLVLGVIVAVFMYF